MDKYYVEINNEEYEVIVRSESEAKSTATAGETTQPTNNSKQAAAAQTEPAQSQQSAPAEPAANANLVSVESPMSGSILSIEVVEGEQVAKDQVVIIIEAMKMETEIFAPAAGEIVEIKAVVGNHCKQGEELAVIKETGGN